MTAAAKTLPLCNDPRARLAGPPPCFYFAVCRNQAQVEKAGRSLCGPCARRLPGQEFPLRGAEWQSANPNDAAFALDMWERG